MLARYLGRGWINKHFLLGQRGTSGAERAGRNERGGANGAISKMVRHSPSAPVPRIPKGHPVKSGSGECYSLRFEFRNNVFTNCSINKVEIIGIRLDTKHFGPQKKC